ncbi:MAG: hypothetical protein Kow00105_14190 [Phycisphaeraceae bacterium]
MMNKTVACLTLLSATLFSGCKSVVSDHLIGEPLAAEDVQEFEGIWLMGEKVLHVGHLKDNILIAGSMEWEEGEFEIEQHTLVLTTKDDAVFLQMVPEKEDGEARDDNIETEDDHQPWVLVGRLASPVSIDDRLLVIYLPEFDQFEKCLNGGQITGELEDEGKTLHIQGDKASLDELVSGDNLKILFHIDHPLVLQRYED